MRYKLFVSLSSLFVCLLGGRVVVAGQGGVVYNAGVQGHFAIQVFTQRSGQTWNFFTDNLSPGSNTVIHVQNYDDPQGGFIAGNDDVDARLGRRSSVSVPPIATTRTLLVIVRAFDNSTGGTCTFSATSTAGDALSYQIAFGGWQTPIPNLAAGAHVTTSEIQERGGDPTEGAVDTVMLVIGGGAEHAIAYDDDDGAGNMSWVHLNEACTANCVVVVGDFQDAGIIRTTNVIWDEDADTADFDGDGLGQGLEDALLTSNHSADTDQDGIPDGLEVLGLDGPPTQKFPAWGASPTQKDLFIEMDWASCKDPTNTTTCPDIDVYKLGHNPMPEAQVPFVMSYVMRAFQPLCNDGNVCNTNDVVVHMDIGVSNLGSTNWGDWGGAERLGPAPGACDGFTPNRKGYFHHTVSGEVTESGIVTDCSYVPPFGDGIAHELGHSLGLDHGGRAFVNDMNYKLNYPSQMNYTYSATRPGFSHGLMATLNPTALNETVGLGTIDPLVMDRVKEKFCPGSQGAGNSNCVNNFGIDWNRDGIISPSTAPVRAAVTYRPSSFGRAILGPDVLLDPAMAWVTVGGAWGDELFTFGHSATARLQYVRQPRTNLALCAAKMGPTVPDTDSDCALLKNATVITNMAITTVAAPAVAELRGATTPTMLVVWQPATGSLLWSTVTVNRSNNNVTFSQSTALPGAVAASGDVTAVSTATGVSVYAPSGGRLREWTYQGGTWSGPLDQRWADDSSLINPLYGIGATRGYQDDQGPELTYAAIASAPNGRVDFARKGTSGSNPTWTRLTGSWADLGSNLGVDIRPVVQGRPGLAYQRMSPSQLILQGRFYMAVNPRSDCASPGPNHPFGDINGPGHEICEAKLLMTEGNLTTGSTRRLVWVSPTSRLGGTDGQDNNPFLALRGISLISDATRDTNLRAARVYPLPQPSGAPKGVFQFSPLADGIINTDMLDLDDFKYLRGALRASLGLEALPLP